MAKGHKYPAVIYNISGKERFLLPQILIKVSFFFSLKIYYFAQVIHASICNESSDFLFYLFFPFSFVFKKLPQGNYRMVIKHFSLHNQYQTAIFKTFVLERFLVMSLIKYHLNKYLIQQLSGGFVLIFN